MAEKILADTCPNARGQVLVVRVEDGKASVVALQWPQTAEVHPHPTSTQGASATSK